MFLIYDNSFYLVNNLCPFDKGRMYDKNGNMRQWWTNSTILEYVNRTSCFVKQYGSYYMPEVSEYVSGLIFVVAKSHINIRFFHDNRLTEKFRWARISLTTVDFAKRFTLTDCM